MLCELILVSIVVKKKVGNFNVSKDLSDFAIAVIIESFHNGLSTIQDDFLIYIHLYQGGSVWSLLYLHILTNLLEPC